MKKPVQLYIEEELKVLLDAEADKNSRSRNGMIEVMIKEYLERDRLSQEEIDRPLSPETKKAQDELVAAAKEINSPRRVEVPGDSRRPNPYACRKCGSTMVAGRCLTCNKK